MLSFFILNYEISNVPIIHTGNINNKIKYYKIYYENKELLHFCFCLPVCCKIKPIINQEAVHL